MSAHQKPSLSGSTWLARVICNFPLAKWLGHSSKVAAQHYLMSRDHHFEDVVGVGDSIPLAGADGVQANPIECDAKCDAAGAGDRRPDQSGYADFGIVEQGRGRSYAASRPQLEIRPSRPQQT